MSRELSREEARARIAVALDVDSAEIARRLANRLAGRVGWIKIGLQLFSHAGTPIVRELADAGHQVFLDVKLHDIPSTVAAAAIETARCGAAMVNVHATGGIRMMRAAAEALARESRRVHRSRVRLLAVTALTSLDESDLADIGLLGPPEELVIRLSALARRAGCDGVVCSPREIRAVRARCGEEFLIVTPGIRPEAPAGAQPRAAEGLADLPERRTDDQKRTATPGEALAAGANVIVIGRPVTAAPDPVAAVERILDEIERRPGDGVREPPAEEAAKRGGRGRPR